MEVPQCAPVNQKERHLEARVNLLDHFVVLHAISINFHNREDNCAHCNRAAVLNVSMLSRPQPSSANGLCNLVKTVANTVYSSLLTVSASITVTAGMDHIVGEQCSPEWDHMYKWALLQ